MAAAGFFDRDEEADDQTSYSRKLSSPMSYFWTMVIFLILAGFTGAILFRQAREAFVSNPGLNGLILGVALIGVLLAFNHVLSPPAGGALVQFLPCCREQPRRRAAIPCCSGRCAP